jgi:hypothetical protein
LQKGYINAGRSEVDENDESRDDLKYGKRARNDSEDDDNEDEHDEDDEEDDEEEEERVVEKSKSKKDKSSKKATSSKRYCIFRKLHQYINP